MKKYIDNFFYPLILILGLIPYLLLLANIDAQSLICDDYSMFFPLYREDGLLETISRIITGINSAHIRITFVPHIFFIGFYRYSNGGPFATNLFFLILLILIILIFILALLIVNSKKEKNITVFSMCSLCTKQNFFLFVIASYLLLSQYIWSLLDFKLANYLTFGLFVMLFLILLTYKSKLNNRFSNVGYFLFYVVTIHSTDVNLLVLAIVIPIIFLKKIKLRIKFILSALMILYPPVYYFSLKLALNRNSILFNEFSVKNLYHQFKFWITPFIDYNQELLIILGIIFSLSTILVMSKFFKSSSLKKNNIIKIIKELHIYLFDREKSYIMGTFFIAFPMLVLIITNIAYGGWINPHQFSFSYLLLILSFILLSKALLDNLNKYKLLTSIIISLTLVLIVYSNIGNLFDYWKVRRSEIAVINSLQNHIEANKSTYGDKNFVVIDSWPTHTFPTYTAFYDTSWASESYAKFYLDSNSQQFQILSPHAISYWGLDLQNIKDSDTESSALIHVAYNKETHTADITDYMCTIMCGEQAISILSGNE